MRFKYPGINDSIFAYLLCVCVCACLCAPPSRNSHMRQDFICSGRSVSHIMLISGVAYNGSIRFIAPVLQRVSSYVILARRAVSVPYTAIKEYLHPPSWFSSSCRSWLNTLWYGYYSVLWFTKSAVKWLLGSSQTQCSRLFIGCRHT